MKRIFLLVMACLCLSVSFGQTNQYATFEADIANFEDPIFIKNQELKILKKFTKNANNTYKDTLKIEKGGYIISVGKQMIGVNLESNSDIKLKLDAKNIEETIVFSGSNSEINNYTYQTIIAYKKIDFKSLLTADDATIKNKIEEMKQADLARIDKYFLNPETNASHKKEFDSQYNIKIFDALKANKEKVLLAKKERELKDAEKNKLNGTISPSFNYRNYKGSKTKLESFKGKYVYIDVWATWCGPCMREVPFLQSVEEKYQGKNIAFVSISIDKQEDFKKWETVVKEKNMGGVQLFADNDWNSDFAKSYGITSIPRFILIDPSGKIIKAVAERPSDPELLKVLEELLN
jgi:thiol-disulfide isomerase/thioredoxin